MRKKEKFINITKIIKRMNSQARGIIIQFSLFKYELNRAGTIKKREQIRKDTIIRTVTTQLHTKKKQNKDTIQKKQKLKTTNLRLIGPCILNQFLKMLQKDDTFLYSILFPANSSTCFG
jgi:hypothetical protein